MAFKLLENPSSKEHGVSKPLVQCFHSAVGPLGCNCSIIGQGEQAIVVDPGGDEDQIIAQLEMQAWKPIYIIHTHAHFDHVGATPALKKRYPDAKVMLHKDDLFLYNIVPKQALMFGLQVENPCAIDASLEDQQFLNIQNSAKNLLQVLHTPGHTPGSCCFLMASEYKLLFSGDTLFKESIGRTDLWGGDFDKIQKSLNEKILTLDPEIRVIPGHGPMTQIGHEKKYNPFL